MVDIALRSGDFPRSSVFAYAQFFQDTRARMQVIRLLFAPATGVQNRAIHAQTGAGLTFAIERLIMPRRVWYAKVK